MKQFWLVIVSMLWFSIAIMGIEERSYTIVKTDGKIEIRDYQRVLSAEVIVQGERNSAASDAFRILFRFIQGKNKSQMVIPMTAPVSQERLKGDTWYVRFFMPASMSLDQAPTPSDPRITIVEHESVRLGAIRFSGFSSQKNLKKHADKLRRYLTDKNILFVDSPMYAFYNAPYVPPFFRRNEILFTIKENN